MSKSHIAFIDADILLHRAVSFCADEFDGEPMGDWKQALNFFVHLKDKWIKEVSGRVTLDDYVMVVSHGRTFRKDLYPEYKANRKDLVPHPAFDGLKNEVMSLQGVVWEENMEADDYIGLMVTQGDGKNIAVSADKDFATLPCQLFIPTSHGRKHIDQFVFTEDEANMNWMRQCMMGDTVDNYKGIPKVGKKGAEKVVPRPAPLDVMWRAVEMAFVQKGCSREYALTMARVARILRHGDYNFETKETKLWEPTR
jgi:DNA polymerase-1